MEHTLDARNLLCPMPVIRVQDAIKKLSPGDILHARCTDPGVKHDIPAWCRINGHHIKNLREEDEAIVISIEVGQ